MNDKNQVKENSFTKDTRRIYLNITKKKSSLLWVLGLITLAMFTIDVMVGPAWLSIKTVFAAIFNPQGVSSAQAVIIWNFRVPIALMALVVGASLGIAGAEMQTVLDNPLASPYTLGVASAASFGAALAMVLGVTVVSGLSGFLVPVNAFLFAMLASFLIYLVSLKKGMSTETMVLAGIAVMFLFQAMLTLLQFIATEQQLQSVIFWSLGSLYKTTWPKLAMASAMLFLVIPILIKDPWKLTALRMGDEKAKSLGVNVERTRLKIFVLVSVLTASAVCFVGTIGFIGLVGPHIGRMLVGEDQRYLLPVSAVAGALLLSTASVLSKLIVPGTIVPIGILTSFIGVPFFLSLILKGGRKYW